MQAIKQERLSIKVLSISVEMSKKWGVGGRAIVCREAPPNSLTADDACVQAP